MRRSSRKQPKADAAVLNEIQLPEPIQITEQGMCYISFSALMPLSGLQEGNLACKEPMSFISSGSVSEWLAKESRGTG